jgi:histidinol-phosphate aminotransferase
MLVPEDVRLMGEDGLLERVQPHLRAAPPYVPVVPPDEVAQRLGLPPESIVKLDANENPYGPSPRVREALLKASTLHIYPDPEQRRVRDALSRYTGFEPRWLIAGAGSDELIDLLVRLFVPPGEAILNFPPTFSFYPFLAGIQNARVVDVLRRPDYSIDLSAAVAAASGTRLIVATSPNNPTGTLMNRHEIETLLSTGVPVIIDEAYTEFAGESCIDMVREHPNLIVLRTLSKWAGLAGLRIGYMVAQPDVIDLVLRIKQPYNVNVAAEVATLASLEDLPLLQGHIDAMVRERERLSRLLGQLEVVEVTPSRANFVLCRLDGIEAREVHARLLERGILVRYFDTPLLQNHIRISAGRPEQTDAFIGALHEILAEMSVGSRTGRQP